jgi:hypothetical protein
MDATKLRNFFLRLSSQKVHKTRIRHNMEKFDGLSHRAVYIKLFNFVFGTFHASILIELDENQNCRFIQTSFITRKHRTVSEPFQAHEVHKALVYVTRTMFLCGWICFYRNDAVFALLKTHY